MHFSLGFVGASKAKGLVLIDRTLGTNIGNMTGGGGLTGVFDGITGLNYPSCSYLAASSVAFVGKQLAAPKIFGQAKYFGSQNAGVGGTVGDPVTINVRGKASSPSSRTDGAIIGTITFADTANESSGRTITSTDLINSWNYIWADVSEPTQIPVCAELQLWEWA